MAVTAIRIEREVKPVLVKMLCPVCYSGELRPTGEINLTHPPKYNHTCSECGNGVVLEKQYPCIEYKEIDE